MNVVERQIEEFFSTYPKKIYKKGSIIIHAGEAPQGIYYVQEGLVKESLITAQGDEVTITIFKPHAFFPMSWAMNAAENNYTFEAFTDVTCWIAPKENVLLFTKEHPEVVYDLLQRVFRGVDGILERMTHTMTASAYARVLTEIIINAQRFGKHANGSIELAITQRELALQTGLTRETISREIALLKKKRLLSYEDHHIFIKEIKSLQNELILSL